MTAEHRPGRVADMTQNSKQESGSPPRMRHCSRCSQHKPATLEFFHGHELKGLQNWCRPCMRAYASQYQSRNRGKVKPKRLGGNLDWRKLAGG